jgi:ribosomal protein S18 acetylase RimI-like enzyme
MEISYRLMKINDFENVVALWKSAPGIGLSSTDEKESIRFFLEKNRNTCFVAVYGEELIGTVICGNDGRRGYLYHLAVKNSFRNRGIGKELVSLCLDGLKNEGIEKCHLFVYTTNESAIHFYKKTNWEERVDITVFSKETKSS